jgi:hypothetical protein
MLRMSGIAQSSIRVMDYGIKSINFKFDPGKLSYEEYKEICSKYPKIEDQRKALALRASAIEVIGYGEEDVFNSN